MRQLSDWLDWLAHWHPVGIDLGLTRVDRVYQQSRFAQFAIPCILVGGTNGKGSVTAFLESILCEAGYSTGVFRSPHLVRYNERVRINAQDATDTAILESFEQTYELAIQEAVSLTYFEFSFIAALECFASAQVDIALLEVGLGGRLDATNVTDPLVSIVTNVGLDHCDWLGDNREVIGYEKAHIYRPQRLGICGDTEPPQSVGEYVEQHDVDYAQIGVDFYCQQDDNQPLLYRSQSRGEISTIPPLRMVGEHQQHNLACAIRAIEGLEQYDWRIEDEHIRQGAAKATLAGRMSQHVIDGQQWLFDVGHNPHAAKALVEAVNQYFPKSKIDIVFGMMADKDITSVVQILSPHVDRWFLCRPAIDRAADLDRLVKEVKTWKTDGQKIFDYPTVSAAIESLTTAIAFQNDTEDARVILVCGSFYTVAEAFESLNLST